MKPNPTTHWTRHDTLVTLLAAILTLAATIGAVAGWNFSL